MSDVGLTKLRWIDSGLSFASTWLNKETIIERAKEWTGYCSAVGIIVYEDEHRIVLCVVKDDESENYAACFLISTKCITSREFIAIDGEMVSAFSDVPRMTE